MKRVTTFSFVVFFLILALCLPTISAPDAQASEGVEESTEKASESGIDEVPF